MHSTGSLHVASQRETNGSWVGQFTVHEEHVFLDVVLKVLGLVEALVQRVEQFVNDGFRRQLLDVLVDAEEQQFGAKDLDTGVEFQIFVEFTTEYFDLLQTMKY